MLIEQVPYPRDLRIEGNEGKSFLSRKTKLKIKGVNIKDEGPGEARNPTKTLPPRLKPFAYVIPYTDIGTFCKYLALPFLYYNYFRVQSDLSNSWSQTLSRLSHTVPAIPEFRMFLLRPQTGKKTKHNKQTNEIVPNIVRNVTPHMGNDSYAIMGQPFVTLMYTNTWMLITSSVLFHGAQTNSALGVSSAHCRGSAGTPRACFIVL